MPGEFLPPEPGGREPDLGSRPAPAPEPYSPPVGAQAPQQPQWAPAQGGQDNSPAVLGFVLSLSSVGLLLISAGLSTVISIGLAIPGMLQSRKGTRRVREGITTRNGGLATAGWVIGIGALVLSVGATIVWSVIAAVIVSDEEARREFEREFEREFDRQRSSVITGLAVAVRVAGVALS